MSLSPCLVLYWQLKENQNCSRKCCAIHAVFGQKIAKITKVSAIWLAPSAHPLNSVVANASLRSGLSDMAVAEIKFFSFGQCT